MRKNRRRIAAGIVAIMLILMMVVSLAAAARGDELEEGAALSASSETETSEEGQVTAADTETAVSAETAAASGQEETETGTAASGLEETGTGTAVSGQEETGTGTAVSGQGKDKTDAAQTGQTDQGGHIYIENIDITDMTPAQAEEALGQKMEELCSDKIVLYAGAGQAVTTAGDLGLTYRNAHVVDEAMSIGKKGNVYKRFCAERALRNSGDIVVDLDLTVPQAKALEVVKEKKEELNCEPRACGLRMNEDRSFSVTPQRDGISVVEEASAIQIANYMNDVWHGGEGGVSLICNVTPGSDSTEELKKVKDILGVGTTSYRPEDDTNRDTNIRLAVDHINGTLLYPGEEFSANEVIGPQNLTTGFKLGGTYSSGGVIQTYGGGVCQVTTTLYNAVLASELEVTERHNHSFLVHYADPAFDAAIAEDSLDFRFVNNLSSPVYIEGDVDSEGLITFQIYGEETRDPSRRIEFINSTGEWIDYETEFVTDSSMWLGYITATNGQEGLDAQLWKYIYTGDNEIPQEELVNISRYDAMPMTYRIGTMNASNETLAMINNAIATGDLYQVQMAVNNGTIETQDAQI